MAVTIADKAHTLGTADDLIDSSAAIAAATTLATGDTLTISGLTQYDTIGIKTGSGASQVRLDTATNTIQYSSDTGSTWSDIGTWDGGDGRTLQITFLTTQISVNTTVVNTLLQSLTIKADTTGTVADSRTLTYTFGGTYTESDTSTYTLVGSANADTIIYSTGAIAFDPLGGDDVLLVKSGMGALSLDMKSTGALELFEVLNATDANSAISLTLGSDVKTVTLGSAADTITIADENDIGTVTVNGGAGRDTLIATATATLTDTELSKFSSVEILTLSNNANSVTLGATNSIDTINGGSDVDTIDASARTVNAAASGFYDLVINAGAGADVVTASLGNDKILLGNDDDTLTITSTNLDSDDYVDGGAGTGDKIILNGVSITDTAFTKVSNVEVLEGIATTTTITLGDKAKAAGIATIDLVTTAATGAATVDMSSMTTNGAFTVLAGTGGTTVKMTAANAAAGDDTLTGDGTATDVLELTTAGTVTLAATITEFDTLKLSSATGNYDITLDDANNFATINATSATGNVTVNASAETDVATQAINTGSGADTITAGDIDTTIASGDGNDTITAGTGTNTIETGAGDDTVNLVAGTDTVDVGAGTDTVNVDYADFTSADTVTGSGEVTLQFTDAVDDGTATVESKMAASGNSIDTIKLGADATQTVTLGTNAAAAGITTIDATALTSGQTLTADLTAFATAAVTVKGGADNDTVQMISADLTAATSIQGGLGDDILEITDEATILDADFTLSTGLETLLLSKTDGANTITIGDYARAAGLTTVDASAVTDATKAQTITVSMTNDADLTIKTGAGADTIKMKGSQLTSGDTIDGDSATDTIEFTDIVNVIDSAFTDVTNVEKIKLSAGDGQKLTLAAQAKEAGILEVDATAAGSVTIDAGGMSVLPLKITTAAGADTITLGSGVATVSTAAGNDTVKINTANLTSADTIDGGADTDTLEIMNAAALVDSNFTKVSNFEALKLSDYDAQSVSLGTAAEAKEIKNIDASALTGSNKVTVTLDSSYEAQTVKVTGGAGADTLKVTNGVVTNTMTFIGGSGIDTLELTNAADIVDGDLSKVQEVETIKLADDSTAQTITLGTNASSAGINKVDGSAMLANGSVTVNAADMTNNMTITTVGGNDTITSGHGNDTISTGAGDDTIKIASEYFNSSDSINGGANTTNGKDILEVTSTNAAIADTAFTNVSNIELLRLSANSEYNLTLSTQAAAKDIKNIEVTGTGGAKIDASALGEAVTIKGGSGVETVTLGATDDVIDLAGGNDVIKLAAASLTTADSIDLGSGTDIIEITTATSGALVDDDFNGVRNAETLKLTIDNNQDVTLGDKALNAGIRTVDASAMKTAGKTLTVDMSSMTSNAAMSVTGGYGNDTVKMKAGHLTSADTVTGDLGSDIIEFVGAVTLSDTDFTNVTGVETIKLSDADNQTVTLGEEARNGGQGVTTVNASALTGANKVTVDLSGMTTDQNMSVTTGAGADTIKTKAAQLTASDTLNGGAGTDTLEFVDQVNFSSSTMFGGVSNIETIKLSDATASNAQTLTLANSTLLNTVDASTITGVVTIDGSAFTNALTITTGTGADVVTVGSGVNTVTAGDGNDKVIITSAALADGNADTLNGGVGSDTLEVTGTTAITDAKLSAITGFETIALTGSGDKSIAVGTNAKAGGVTTVDASTTSGANTINASAFNGTITLKGGSGVDTITAGTGSNTIQAGGGDDIITIDATTLDLNDTIGGGDGTDTLVLTGIANLSDANFTNVTGIEKLVFANETGQVVVLGTEAKQAGIVTIDTSAVATTKTVSLDIAGMTSTNVTITGGAADETVKMASADLTTADTITAGAGTDTLELTTASELVAADMANISGFEKLKLANVDATQSLTLANGKFSEIDGSAITYTQAITIDASAQSSALSITTKGGADTITLGTGANTLDSGSGNDTIRVTASTFDSSDTLNTGNGTDTLEISGTAVVVDAMFDNVSGLETVKLVTDTTGQSVTLASTHAGNAGINKVDTTSVTSSVSVDISGMGTGVTVNTGGGADTITMGQGIDTINAGGGNDTIKVASAYLTSADVINGAAGTNTLHITDKAVITDDKVVGVTNIDTLKLSDDANAQTVTLGTNAKNNNLLKVDSSLIAANHALTLDISGLSSKDVTVTGGAGNETVKMASADLTAADTIALGLGTDVLEFTDAVNMTNTALQTGLSGIDKITLGDFATTLTLKDGIGTSLEVNAQAATGVKAAVIDISALGATTTTAIVKTSGGDDTITLGGSVNTVDAGSGNDTINMSNANLINSSADTINGGSGTDKLRLTTAGTLTDTSLASITNVEELVVTADSDQTVTLGSNFANNGFTTVDASGLTTGKLSLDITSAVKTGDVDIDITLKGGGANDTITVNSTKLTATDTIDGNGGTDILLIKNGAGSTITDAQFTKISEIETIKYAESYDHSLTIGDSAKTAGIATVDASALIGSAKLTLDASSMGTDTALTIKSGAGNDEVTMLATHLTSSDVLQLGTGTNTLKLSGADTLIDTDFSGSNSGISKILYTQDQAQSITVGSTMVTAGLGTIDATVLSTAVATINISAVTASFIINSGGGADVITLGNSTVMINSGTGDDLIKTNGTYLELTDTINGGGGTDTLEITTADNLIDADFTGVTNIETLKLSQNAAQSVVLGTEATDAGIVTVDASAVTTNTNVVTIDTKDMTSDKAMSITAGAGNDTIKTKGTYLTSADTINGGGGTDTLEITTADNLIDADFTGVTNIETLKLSQNAAQSVVLGTEATEAGIVTVDASAVTTITNVVTIDTKDMTSDKTMSITAGAGNDTIKTKGTYLTSADTINGGTGTDTLEITVADNLVDTDFTGVTAIETLKLSEDAAQSVTFGAKGYDSGIVTINAAAVTTSTNVVTIDIKDMTSDKTMSIATGAGDDVIKLKGAHLTSTDTINGGSGTDTLEITTADNLVDTDFTGVTNVETLKLSQDAAQSVVLGAEASQAGIVTVNAAGVTTSTNDITIDTVAMSSAGMTIIAGAGDDLIRFKTGELTSADSVDGGDGDDTLEIAAAAGTNTIADAAFTNVTDIKTLKVTNTGGSNVVTFAAEAKEAGITVIDASGNTNGGFSTTFDFSTAAADGDYTVTGSAGADTIKIKSEHLTSADTISGGNNTDTIEFSTVINSSDSTIFNGVSSVEKIVLVAGNDQKVTLNAFGNALTIDAKTNLTAANDKVTVDADLMTNNLTLNSAGGADTLSMGTGVDTIDLGAGDDVVKAKNGRLTSADTIKFGTGTDTLEMLQAATISDTDFTLVTGLEKIVLANGVNSVTLGDLAYTAAVHTVDGSASTSAMTVKWEAQSDIGSGITVTGGTGNDTIEMKAGHLSANDVIGGGDGTDVLSLKGTGIIYDDVFVNKTSIETLKLANADQDYTLGTNAISAGITSIDTTDVTTAKIRLDLSAMTTDFTVATKGGNDTVVMGSGDDDISTGAGDDTIRIAGDRLSAADSIDGEGGNDVLEFTSAISISDNALLGGVSNIETYKLANAADQVLTLKADAVLTTIDATALIGTNKVTVDATAMTTDLIVKTGNGNDTIIAGSGSVYTVESGSGDDLIQFGAASDIDNTDSIKGGVGKDTLELTDTTAQSIDSTFFGTHITGIEVLKVADVTGHDIDLSTATTAMTSGINTIDTSLVGTTKAATIDVSGFTTNVSVLGGAGNETVTAGKGVDTYTLGAGDDVLNINNTYWTKDDTISMGDGNDTVNIESAAAITDEMFTKVSGAETMVLLDATKDKTVTLGLFAKNSGLNEIDASALNGASSATAKKAIIDASLMTNDMTITTGTGYDIVTMGKGDDVISTGEGNDTIKVSGAQFTLDDEIDGGVGTDTLMFTDSVTLADVSFTNITNIEVIKLSDFDRQTVVLGDIALGKDILTVDASLLGAGNRSTIDFSTATSDEIVSVTGGKGDDTIKMRAVDFTAADTIHAGTGIDTVHITTASSGANAVSDDDFTLVTGLETLKLSDFDAQSIVVAAKAKTAGLKTIDATSLSGANAVTVDVTAMGGVTVKTGSGNDIIKAGTTTAVDTIEAGSGDDTIEIKTAAFAGDVIDGGNGTDTILITDLATIIDAKFSAVSNVEVLKVSDMTGTSTITLGTNADAAGIVSVDATLLSGTNKAAIDTSLMSGNVEIKTSIGDDVITLGSGVSTVTSGSGADTIKVASAHLTSADTISGGLGNDTLWTTTASSGGDAVADTDFTNISGVETLKLSNFASQTVTLGTNARLAGINTVDATALTTSTFGVTIDTSAMSSSVTLKGGAGNDLFKLGTSNDTIQGGTGNDTIQLNSSDLTSFDTFDGGVGIDILEITDAATVVDDDFTGISNLETLKLGDFASQTVNVGTKASVTTVGLKTIDASAVTTGSTVNASEATIALTIFGGSGNDTLLASKGANTITAGDGNDTIKIASVGFDASDKIDGGNGTDVLEITDAANLIDTAWSNINGIETIKLNDFASQSIVLGVSAQTKGITNINATGLTGTNSLTVNTSAMTVNKDLNIQTGTGDDIFTVRKAFLDSNDILKAGSGNDTLMFSDSVSIDDTFFASLDVNADFEVLALSNFASQSVVLGSNAETQGITTVDLSKVIAATNNVTVTSTMDSALIVLGGTGIDTITTNSGDYDDTISAGAGNDIITIGSGDDTVTGGIGNDTVKVAVANLDASDTIDGEAGIDTLELTTAGTLTDAQLDGLTSVEIIRLANGVNSVTLADKALEAGITTIHGQYSTSALTMDASAFTGNLSVYGGNGNDIITAGSGNDVLVGGNGNDTYKFSSFNLTQNDKIIDSGGTDTLLITDAASITDAMFTGIKGIEVIKLTADVANQTIALGTYAKAAGITTIDIRGIDPSNVTFNTSAYAGTLTILSDLKGGIYKGGTGNDTFQLSEISFDSDNGTNLSTITGSSGIDTLEITTTANVADIDFGKTTGVEIFKFSSNGGSVVLETLAKKAGIVTVDASAANSAVTANATAMALTTLSYIEGGTVVDSDFANISGFASLKFAKGDNTVTLGSTAAAKFSVATLDALASVAGDNSTYDLDAYAQVEAVVFKSGAGNETVVFNDNQFDGTHIITAGTGTDTIEIADAATIFDINFGTSKITGVEVLKLTTGGSVTLGAKALAAGITTVDLSATTAANTIDSSGMSRGVIAKLGNTADTITFGTYADMIQVSRAHLSSADTINLGTGTTLDTIQFTDAGAVADGAFDNVSNLEVIKFAAGNNTAVLAGNVSDALTSTLLTSRVIDATLSVAGNASSYDISAMTEAVTFKGGVGAETIVMGDQDHNIIAGEGDDTISMTNGNLVSTYASTIDGGLGTDTLSISDAAAITDAQLTKVRGIEILELTANDNAQTVTLDAFANAAGVVKVDASAAGSVTIDNALTTNKAMTFIGGAGADTFKFKNATFDLADTVTGAGGTDVIEITDKATIIDTDFKKTTGVETLKIGNFAGQIVTLGTFATSAGIRTVDASVLTGTNFIKMDTSTMGAADMTLIAGAGADTFVMKGSDLNGSDTLTGSGGSDTLQLSGNTTLIDTAFAGVTDVEKLLLNVGATYNLTLGSANAEDKAKIVAVDGSKLTTTALTLDASGYATAALTVTAGGGADSIKTGGGNDVITSGAGDDSIESGAGNDTVTAGAGNDTITSGAGNDTLDGGDGDDIFKFTDTNFNYTDASNADTIVGGAGSDTIWITDAASIVDTQFTKVTTTEVLKLAATDAAQSVVLDAKATAAGIIKVDASAAGSVTIDNAMTTNKAMTLIGGAGADTFKFKNATFDLADTVTGAGGTDVIEITDKATIIDTDFTKVTGVETLKIGNFAGQMVTLGVKAKVSGLTKVDASAVETGITLNASTMGFTAGSAGITLIGGKGADTVYGSSGNDIFVFSSADGMTGADKVYNFADTKDKIALSGIAGGTAGNALSGGDFATYVDTIVQSGDDTLITLKTGTATDTITLLGVEATNITVADFIYG